MSYFDPADLPEWGGGQDWFCWGCNQRIGECECGNTKQHLWCQFTVCPECREEMIDAEIFVDKHVEQGCERYNDDDDYLFHYIG
jgi:hypothetical protein